MTFTLLFPSRVVFGPGTFAQLGAVCEGLGRRALIVTGRQALRRSGRLQQAQELLAGRGVAVDLFEGVENDPSLETCARGIACVRERGIDLVIAIGGGSAIDAGKTFATLATQPFTVQEFFDGRRDIERPALPFVALPTTAGTGSECTRVAVLTDTVRAIKKGVRHDFMMPRAAIVDPDLTLTAPPDVTAQTGMDALTQAIECYVCKDANPVTDALAAPAMALIARNLPGAVRAGDRLEHREPVALGSMTAAMAFSNAGLGAVHGLAHPIGVLCHAPHGLICAVLLPHVCAFNQSALPEKFEEIARRLGAPSGRELPAFLRALNRQLGIPDTLRGFGLAESLFPRIIANSRSGSMARNPRPASDADLAGILARVSEG